MSIPTSKLIPAIAFTLILARVVFVAVTYVVVHFSPIPAILR